MRGAGGSALVSNLPPPAVSVACSLVGCLRAFCRSGGGSTPFMGSLPSGCWLDHRFCCISARWWRHWRHARAAGLRWASPHAVQYQAAVCFGGCCQVTVLVGAESRTAEGAAGRWRTQGLRAGRGHSLSGAGGWRSRLG
eukprot:418709-Alexandrium_andersonii.AAC.1